MATGGGRLTMHSGGEGVNARRHSSGLTLIELLVTITVAAVLLGIAIPSYKFILVTNRLASTANDFVVGIRQAQAEAVRRNAPTQFCSDVADTNGADDLGASCGTSAGAVYVLNSDGSRTKIYTAPSLPADLSVSASGTGVTALRFTGQGLAQAVGGSGPYTGLVADISTSELSDSNHRCVYLTTGSLVSSCTYTSASEGCPADEPASCQ
ncbi:GspH/FimT family pseudopilin [Solimonas variicoloris]|uniref:GspH/FimT family pseudopilin n=1 Tax=Solimonas variicoloris TaxID=254408 RepID=UPI000475C206|nr:GspH/FimT family pseudopilin [Solimonas variicoloris]